MVGNVALYLALRIGSRVLPYVPLRLAYAAASIAGTIAYYLFPIPRRQIMANLSRVRPGSPHRDLQEMARRAFKFDAKNWVDTLRIGSLTEFEILNAVNVQGWENLDNALARGKGVVLVTLHLGNYDLVGQALAARGYRVTVPVERMAPTALFEFLLRERRSKGINAVPLERAPREMLSALRAGEIAGVAGDRYVVGHGESVLFFGADAVLPVAPVSLARHTGAALVVGVGVRLPSDQFRGFITAPIAQLDSGNPHRDDRENARQLAAVMESLISRYPDQWLVFSPVWRSRAEDPAVTIEQQNEAAV